MSKKVQYDPELTKVQEILERLRKTNVLKWRMPWLKEWLVKLKKIQAERGGGLFGMDITPEIDFLEAAIKFKSVLKKG